MSTTATTRLHVTKLGEHIGARIGGLDLAGALDPDTVSAIREALNEHKALVFSQSGIASDEQQELFASHFGPLTTAHPTVTFEEQVKKTVLPVDSEQSIAINGTRTSPLLLILPRFLPFARSRCHLMEGKRLSPMRLPPTEACPRSFKLWQIHCGLSTLMTRTMSGQEP